MDITKREFLSLVAVSTGMAAGCYTREDGEQILAVGGAPGDEHPFTIPMSDVKAFKAATSTADLDEPDQYPAVAVTADEGVVINLGDS